MLLRKYEPNDAKIISTWIKSERDLRLWSADRYSSYPINAKDINENYMLSMKENNFYPLTLVDNSKQVGHLILRNPNKDKSLFRMGFVIIDPNLRKKGIGKKLVLQGINYAKEKLNATSITLGVFTNNLSAINCYKSCGFKVVDTQKNVFKFYDENWDLTEMILI